MLAITQTLIKERHTQDAFKEGARAGIRYGIDSLEDELEEKLRETLDVEELVDDKFRETLWTSEVYKSSIENSNSAREELFILQANLQLIAPQPINNAVQEVVSAVWNGPQGKEDYSTSSEGHKRMMLARELLVIAVRTHLGIK